MSKRFTATDKWRDRWFRTLPPEYKLFWIYILDECNHAGIWEVDIELANFIMGLDIDQETAINHFKDRIQIFKKGQKWFIPKFITFQYGVLNPENRAHLSAIGLLKGEGLYKGLISSLNGAKDKDKDKEQDKAKDKDKEKIIGKFFELLWRRYPKKLGKKEALNHFKASVKNDEDCHNIEKAIDKYLNHIDKKGVEYQFIMNGSTWFNNWEDWIDYEEVEDIPRSMRGPMEFIREREDKLNG